MARVRVLVIDDTALVRKLMTAMLTCDPGIEVVGAAADPLIASEKIRRLAPDVLTLNVEAARLEGLAFLRNLMRLHPLPLIAVSALGARGADAILCALELGAVDLFAKPSVDLAVSFGARAEEICAKVKLAARARPQAGVVVQNPGASMRPAADVRLPAAVTGHPYGGALIAIGASIGGTEALRMVLQSMPADAPPILIGQHIPAVLGEPFAQRLDRVCAIRVCVARDGQSVQSGHAYIAPGDAHLLLQREGGAYVCRLRDGPAVDRHKPSIDVLFHSVAQCADADSVATLLTGMGDDGARGLLALQRVGAATLVQDEPSSVLWDMPGAAWKLGAAREMLPLEHMAARLLTLARSPCAKTEPC